jgi:hypothetical protein
VPNCRVNFGKSGGLSVIVLLIWALAVSVPITYLMAGHSLPLPVRPVAPAATAAAPGIGHWQAVHILVADCPCSASVAKYLAGRKAQPGLDEQVWIVGGTADWEKSFLDSGFTILHRDADQVAAQTGVQGGPWLRLLSPAGVVAYSGGYAPQRPGRAADIRDLAVWRAVAGGQIVPPYPAFGCAASSWLRKTIDPLRAQYRTAK